MRELRLCGRAHLVFRAAGLVDDTAHILQAVAATQGDHLGDLASAVAREEGSLSECLALLPV
jgi:hypothetical protein